MNQAGKFLLLIFIFIHISGVCDNTDSIIKVINDPKIQPKNKVNTLLDLGWAINAHNLDSAILLSEQALEIATNNNLKKGIVRSAGFLGIYNYVKGNYPLALQYYFKALKLNEELNDKQGITTTYGNIGVTYSTQGDHEKALDYFTRSLKMSEELGDKRGISSKLTNIGIIYSEKKDYAKAMEYFSRALVIDEELNDKQCLAIDLGNIGLAHKRQQNYNKALEYYFKSLKLREELGDKELMSSMYDNIGALYIEVPSLPSPAGETKKGYALAEYYLKKALLIAEETGILDNIRLTNNNLSDLYSKTNRPLLAFEHYKKYIAARDSIFNEENIKKNVQAEMNFDFEKKEAVLKEQQEKEKLVAEEKSRKQTIIIWSVAAGLLLAAVFAAFIFQALRTTRKQKQIIELKSKEIEEQKHLVEEKHKEITDSINYAERIQRSFLATDELLKENLKEYFVFFRPKDVVSGDFYWASKLNDNNFAVVVADSTGHGVPGAIMSILNISSLEKSVEEKQLCEPGAILNYTRKKIIERLKKDGSADGGKDGMDCSLIVLDLHHGKLKYSAANNPVWLVRENSVFDLDVNKMPVGKHDHDTVPFSQNTVDVTKGDMIYLITDGLPDQFGGPKGKKFMYKQLKQMLVSISHLSMAEQQEKISTSLNDWKGDLEQVDDITVMGIRV